MKLQADGDFGEWITVAGNQTQRTPLRHIDSSPHGSRQRLETGE
jgi:hypothetical protein